MPTPRENLLRTLKREGFDSAPLDFELCPSQLERFKSETGAQDPADHFALPARSLWLEGTSTLADPAALYEGSLPQATSFDAFGIARVPGGEGSYHFTRMLHPLKGEISERCVAEHPFPRIDEAAVEGLDSGCAALRARGLAAVGALACTVWETAWYLRGMEDLMADMMTGDPRATILLDRVTELARRKAGLYARAGCDILSLGDDIGMQSSIIMSVELWRTWLKPRLASVVAAAKAAKPDILIFYHSCGYILPFIEELMEIGVDILNPVQPESMPFEEVWSAFGDRLSFWGTVGTQTTLPFGKPEDVRRAVDANLRRCGERGGIVIAPTHVLEPEVPWENFMAMVEAARGFRF